MSSVLFALAALAVMAAADVAERMEQHGLQRVRS